MFVRNLRRYELTNVRCPPPIEVIGNEKSCLLTRAVAPRASVGTRVNPEGGLCHGERCAGQARTGFPLYAHLANSPLWLADGGKSRDAEQVFLFAIFSTFLFSRANQQRAVFVRVIHTTGLGSRARCSALRRAAQAALIRGSQAVNGCRAVLLAGCAES